MLGDSFSFVDERGPVLPGAATVWPTVAADALAEALGVEVRLEVLAAPARTARETLDLVRGDRHVQFEVLAWADAVVVAVGSYDHAPVGVPAPAFALVRAVRPAGLRRRLRAALHRLHPVLVRMTGGRVSRTAWWSFAADYAALLGHVRGVAHGSAAVALGPASHRSRYYGSTHPRFPARARGQLALAGEQGLAVVAPHLLVEVGDEPRNPDGIHWHAGVHERVGRAVALALGDQLRGRSPRPPRPGRDEG